MKIKHCISFSILLGSAAIVSCADVEPKLTNDYRPLLPEEVVTGDVSQLDYGELLAFPGAQGHGKNTTGGRGGAVYRVTSLSDNGSVGTFRHAVSQKGARTIVFEVAGTIQLQSELRITNGDLTIAGQTSPGGICLAGNPVSIAADNVIIRFLRFRPGNPDVDADGLGGMDRQNIIIDHCSVSWSTDEVLSVYAMQHSTVQWCLASQALRVVAAKSSEDEGGSTSFQTHGFGGNWGGHYASYHHNMIAHCESRVPRLGPRPTTMELGELVDIRNNVYYNYAGEGCYGGETQHANIVNNYYKPGPATEEDRNGARKNRIAKLGFYETDYDNGDAFLKFRWEWGTFYIDGNKIEGNDDATNDNWSGGVLNQWSKSDYETEDPKNAEAWGNWADVKDTNPTAWTQWSTVHSDAPVVNANGVTTYSADETYTKVLQYVGACNYRDGLDELIVSDVTKGEATVTAKDESYPAGFNEDKNLPGYINDPSDLEGHIETDADGWPVLNTDETRDVTDTDGDGIPDAWEEEHGLNPQYAEDGNATTIDVNGAYTNLEMYMNSLVKDIMDACTEGGTLAE